MKQQSNYWDQVCRGIRLERFEPTGLETWSHSTNSTFAMPSRNPVRPRRPKSAAKLARTAALTLAAGIAAAVLLL